MQRQSPIKSGRKINMRLIVSEQDKYGSMERVIFPQETNVLHSERDRMVHQGDFPNERNNKFLYRVQVALKDMETQVVGPHHPHRQCRRYRLRRSQNDLGSLRNQRFVLITMNR